MFLKRLLLFFSTYYGVKQTNSFTTVGVSLIVTKMSKLGIVECWMTIEFEIYKFQKAEATRVSTCASDALVVSN